MPQTYLTVLQGLAQVCTRLVNVAPSRALETGLHVQLKEFVAQVVQRPLNGLELFEEFDVIGLGHVEHFEHTVQMTSRGLEAVDDGALLRGRTTLRHRQSLRHAEPLRLHCREGLRRAGGNRHPDLPAGLRHY
jgi:hypothetical protein